MVTSRYAELAEPGRIVLREEELDIGPDQVLIRICLLYTSPSPRDSTSSRMPSSA